MAKVDSQMCAVVFDEVQPGRQCADFQTKRCYNSRRNGARLTHFEDAVTEMPPHQIGAKPFAAEEHGSAVATIASGEKSLRMAAMASFEYLERILAFRHDFANAIAAAVGTRRTEHDLALQKQRLGARKFGRQKESKRVLSSFCI